MLNATTWSSPTTTVFPPDPAADKVLAAVYLFCFIVGVPGNVLAVAFFFRDQTRSAKKKFFR